MSGLSLLLANERPLINIDITLLMNIALWFALFFFLRATLWGPMLKLIAAREAGTEGSRAEARRLEADARALREKVDAQLKAARADASRLREELRSQGSAQESTILTAARADVNASVEREKVDLRAQRDRVRDEVMAQVPGIASDIAAKALRREVRA